MYAQVLQKLSKEEIWNKYQDEINQMKKENEGIYILLNFYYIFTNLIFKLNSNSFYSVSV